MTETQAAGPAAPSAASLALKRNKGEWSEVWAVLKTLAEGRIATVRQSDGKIVPSGASVMVGSLRTGRSGQIVEYELRRGQSGRLDELLILDAVSKTILDRFSAQVVQQDFAAFDSELKAAVQNASSSTFDLPCARQIFDKYRFGSGKSPSKLKRDCELVLVAPDGINEDVRGFSIKSYTGGLPTLFNASGAAGFLYRLNGETADRAKSLIANSPNKGIGWVVARVDGLNNLHAFSAEVRADNPAFAKNLSLLDHRMALVIGHLLRFGKGSNGNAVKTALESLIQADPLGIGSTYARTYYSFRVRHFLRAVALGMTAGTPWNGDEDAEGGMLVVSKRWNLYCLLAGKREFEQYLLDTTFFDTASTKRLDRYADLIEDLDGNAWFKLYLQIREADPFA